MSEDNIIENVNEAVSEMKEANSLTDILNQRTKYAEREVVTYLDYDAAIEAFEIQEEIEYLNNAIPNVSTEKYKSIVDDDSESEELIARRDELAERLVALNEPIQDSKVVWTVRGLAPKEFKMIDKMSRQKYPIAKDASEHIKIEEQLKRNDYVNIESIRSGVVKAEFADGQVITEFTHDDMKNLFDNAPMEISLAIREKIDELTYASRTFHNEVESADFLSNN